MLARMFVVLSLLFSVQISTCFGDCFFRTYAFDDDWGTFDTAIEVSSDTIAILQKDCGFAPFVDGVMLLDVSGDSLLFSESPANHSCVNFNNEFVLAWFVPDEVMLTWVNIFGEIVHEASVPVAYYNYGLENIILTSDGGNLCFGECFAVKTDVAGMFEWEFPGVQSLNDYSCAAQGVDGCYLLGGDSYSVMCQNISSDATLNWEWTTVDFGMRPYTAIGTPDSGYVLGSWAGEIYKLSSSGDSLWHYSSEYEVFYTDILLSGNDVLACGGAFYDTLSVLTRLDPDGNLIWERVYPDCGLISVLEAMDGGFILTGYYPYYYEDDNSSLIIKTDSEGWWGGTGIEPEHYVRDLDISIYPNPTSCFSVVTFTLDYLSMVNLEVFDATGRLVMEFSETWFNPGRNEILIEDLGSGIYFCRLNSGNFTATQRFVIIE